MKHFYEKVAMSCGVFVTFESDTRVSRQVKGQLKNNEHQSYLPHIVDLPELCKERQRRRLLLSNKFLRWITLTATKQNMQTDIH